MKLSHEDLRTRAYIQAACPPIKVAPDGPWVPWDPKRREFRNAALRFFEDGRPRAFRTWLTETYPKWRHSPTAQFLVGVSYWFEHRLDEAWGFYDEAEGNWRELEELGELREPEASWLRNSLVTNRALVCRARGRPEEAYRLVTEALDASLPEGEETDAEVRRASGTLWLSLLRLASIQRDEERIRTVFEAMNARHPAWEQDDLLSERLAVSPDLAVARDVLGERIAPLVQRAEASEREEAPLRSAEGVPV